MSGRRRARPIRFDSFWRRGFVGIFLGMSFSWLDALGAAHPYRSRADGCNGDVAG
jgi:hypothetical protein